MRNHIPKILCILLTGGAYAPDATCIATPLESGILLGGEGKGPAFPPPHPVVQRFNVQLNTLYVIFGMIFTVQMTKQTVSS